MMSMPRNFRVFLYRQIGQKIEQKTRIQRRNTSLQMPVALSVRVGALVAAAERETSLHRKI